MDFFAGAVGAAFNLLSRTLLGVAAPVWLPTIVKASEVIMKVTAAQAVTFDSTVVEPRGPNTVCEPMPPKAPARSAAFPLCSSTMTVKTRQTMTWIAVSR